MAVQQFVQKHKMFHAIACCLMGLEGAPLFLLCLLCTSNACAVAPPVVLCPSDGAIGLSFVLSAKGVAALLG